MRTFHIIIDQERGVDTDRHADQIASSLSDLNPIVSYSHGYGPAIIVVDTADSAIPDQMFTIKTDEGSFILKYAEVKPNEQQTESVGVQPGEASSDASAGNGTSSQQAADVGNTQGLPKRRGN